MRTLTAAFGAAWVLAFHLSPLTPSAQGPPAPGEFRPPPPPEQPIAYSHKAHLALDVTCRTCHVEADTGDRATIPPASLCMNCHTRVSVDSPEVQKLAGYHARQEDVPWRRVYRVPTYVYFSHRVHMAAPNVACETCHGNVREMPVMQKVKDTSMAACIQCHMERSAPVRCDTCHEPREP
jgi:hypothetical protein